MQLNLQKQDDHVSENKVFQDNSNQAEQSQDKALEIDVSAMETETDSNIVVPEQALTPSARLSEPNSDLKVDEPKTSGTEGKLMPLASFEEEKEQE